MLTYLLPMLQSGSADAINMQYSGQGEVGIIPTLIGLAFFVLMIVAQWKIHTKAGQPGWAMFIPIYNVIVWLRICGRPWYWLLLMIPLFFILPIILCFDLAKRFGQGVGFGFGILFLGFIFIPILAFGDAKYTPAPAN